MLGFDYSGAIDLQQTLPVPLPVPLYLALEAMLIVSLQLADALPLCAALLSASFVAHHTSALVGQMLLPLCLVIAALLNMLATVALKWAVLGRVRPGVVTRSTAGGTCATGSSSRGCTAMTCCSATLWSAHHCIMRGCAYWVRASVRGRA